jgi:hypothetical protein
MPLFSVGIKPKTDDKGNELGVKKKEMTFKNQLKTKKKDNLGKETGSFPILSTAPTGCFFLHKFYYFWKNIIW